MKKPLNALPGLSLSGLSGVTSLLAGGPAWVAAVAVTLGMLLSFGLSVVQSLMPQDSPDRLAFWQDLLRYRITRKGLPTGDPAGAVMVLAEPSETPGREKELTS